MEIIEFKGIKVPLCYKLTPTLSVSLMTCEDEENNSRTMIYKKKMELMKQKEVKERLKLDEIDKCFGNASIFLLNEL